MNRSPILMNDDAVAVRRQSQFVPGSERVASPEVQVWLAQPHLVQEAQWQVLQSVLDPGEREQAACLRMTADHRSYVLAHALRRLALAELLVFPPAELQFKADSAGKPVLLEPAATQIHFSHSHSRTLVAFGISGCAPIGLDVEAVREDIADLSLLAPFMDVTAAQLRSKLSGEPARLFFFCWTALEAFWKAQGRGLDSRNPRLRWAHSGRGHFELSAGPAGAPRARLFAIEAVPGHAIAVALAHSDAAPDTESSPAVALRDGNQLIQMKCMALQSYGAPAQADRGLR